MASLTFDRAQGLSTRTLLLGSLILNVFLIGLALALFWQPFAAPVTPPDRSLAARIDQLAATLPPADAQILRTEFSAKLGEIEGAREAYRVALDGTRGPLKAAPFDAETARQSLLVARQKRSAIDETLSVALVAAAARMSANGRDKLAAWRSGTRRR